MGSPETRRKNNDERNPPGRDRDRGKEDGKEAPPRGARYHRPEACGPDGRPDGLTIEQAMQKNRILCEPVHVQSHNLTLDDVRQSMEKACRCAKERGEEIGRRNGGDAEHRSAQAIAGSVCQKCSTLFRSLGGSEEEVPDASAPAPASKEPKASAVPKEDFEAWAWLRDQVAARATHTSADERIADDIWDMITSGSIPAQARPWIGQGRAVLGHRVEEMRAFFASKHRIDKKKIKVLRRKAERAEILDQKIQAIDHMRRKLRALQALPQAGPARAPQQRSRA